MRKVKKIKLQKAQCQRLQDSEINKVNRPAQDLILTKKTGLIGIRELIISDINLFYE
jgi:hypothetical protein